MMEIDSPGVLFSITIGERVKGRLLPSSVAATETYFSCQTSTVTGPNWFSTRIREFKGTSIRIPSSAKVVSVSAKSESNEISAMQRTTKQIANARSLKTIPFKFNEETGGEIRRIIRSCRSGAKAPMRYFSIMSSIEGSLREGEA